MEADAILLSELEKMGFSKVQATKAIRAGNSDIEAAINWIVDHENDTSASETPMVPVNINIEASVPFDISEQVKMRAEELRNQARKNKAEQEKKLEREREKERIRSGKELLEAKRLAEESERKRFLAHWKSEKEEERRAREKIRHKLHQDKLERKGIIGLPGKDLPVKSASPQITRNLSPVDCTLLPVKPAAEREHMRECLRSLKRRNKENNAEVIRTFHTLLIYVKNVVKNPNEEKFRKIRISNPAFQDRVGKFVEGVKFLELCGFEKVDGDKEKMMKNGNMTISRTMNLKPQVWCLSNRGDGVTDLRLKIQRKSIEQAAQGVKGSVSGGARDLREKLSGTLYSRPVEFRPLPLRPKPAPRVDSLDNFLRSLDLEKYSLLLQTEEGPRKKILLALETKV